MKKRNRVTKNREQLAFELDDILTELEKPFISKLTGHFKRLTNKLLQKVDNLPLFKKALKIADPKDLEQLEKMIQKYYRKIGKASINKLNEEIKELSGQRSSIRIPDINEGLRYRSEQLAAQKTKDFQKALRDKINDSDIPDKKTLIRTIKNASKVFLNRNILIVSRMESVTAANNQRLEAMNKSKIVKGVQFLSVVDDRRTDICKARHLMVLPLNSPLLPNFTPVCHWGCRSLLSPVTIYEDIPFTSIAKLKSVPDKDFGKDKKAS